MPVPQAASVVQVPGPASGVPGGPQLMAKAMVAAAVSHKPRLCLVIVDTPLFG